MCCFNRFITTKIVPAPSRKFIEEFLFSIRIFIIFILVVQWKFRRVTCANHVKNDIQIIQDNSTSNNIYNNGLMANEKSGLHPELKRGKRFLDFTKGARMSWRTAVKNNILNVNTLWGYGYGFRSNFPFPNKEDRNNHFSKRELLHAVQFSLDRHGFDGRACILRAYCAAVLDPLEEFSGGMLFKMLQLFFNQFTDEGKTLSFLNPRNCWQLLHAHCPLSFNNLSPFTDDV